MDRHLEPGPHLPQHLPGTQLSRGQAQGVSLCRYIQHVYMYPCRKVREIARDACLRRGNPRNRAISRSYPHACQGAR